MRLKKILLLFSPVVIIVAAIWKLNILSVEKMTVFSNAECVSEQDLKRELNVVGKNLFDINSSRIKTEIMAKYLCIKDINMSYEFPRNIKIIVSGRKFLTKVNYLDQTINLPDLESSASSEAALIDWVFPTNASQDALIVDDTGLIFSNKMPSFPLPTLFLSENLVLGKQMDKKLFSLIDQIFTKSLQLQPLSDKLDFKAKKDGSILLIDTSPKVAFSLERDVLRQLASLQLILQKAKMDGRMADIIDLRFDKPIVEYQPKLSK